MVWLTVCYLFYEIQTLSIIHPVYGLPLDPLPVRTKTHTHMYIYKYKQLGRHNGCIVLHGHVMKWAMSKLLAHYTRKQLSGGETEPFPNLWQFACIAKRPNPHQPALSVSSTWKVLFYFQCIHQCTGLIRSDICLSCWDILNIFTCCTPAAPARRCACWNTPGVSRWRSWY